MTGAGVVVIILVPTLFQVVLLSIRQAQRHKEIQERLKKIEAKLFE